MPFSRIIQFQGFGPVGIEGSDPGAELTLATFSKMKLGHIFMGADERRNLSPKPSRKQTKPLSKQLEKEFEEAKDTTFAPP